MPIDWNSVFSTIIDITVAVGREAMKISVIDTAVEKARQLTAENLVVAFSTEVAQMDDDVWSAWQQRLFFLAQNNDAVADFMLRIGNYTRQEMQLIPQLTRYSFDDALKIALEKMQDQSLYEQLCFLATFIEMGKHDLKLSMVAKRLLRLLSSGS